MDDIKHRDETFNCLEPELSVRTGRKPISREVLAGTIQVLDFAAILAGGSVAFWIYFLSILGNTGAGDLNRYSLTTVLAGMIFLFLMRRSQSYRFERLG